eukprot:m.7451 g.7451  ORF g.7451 m.7451 type:complete len:354 (-) comp3717_c0_seq2:49-1110(-)
MINGQVYSVVAVSSLACVTAIWLTTSTCHDGTWLLSQLIQTIDPSELSHSRIKELNEICFSRWERGYTNENRPPEQTPTIVYSNMPKDFVIDFSKPLLVKGFLNGTSGLDAWSFDALMQSPVADLEIDYFPDATKPLELIPKARGRVGDILKSIKNGSSAKFGSQLLFQKHPALLSSQEEVVKRLTNLFGNHFSEAGLKSRFLTIPVFASGALNKNINRTSSKTPRTDLHCEPITNVAMQVQGRKKWTLVMPEESAYLRPSGSEESRAYIMSNLHPNSDRFNKIKRYEIEVETGDAVYIPAWTWHRVDYLHGEMALSVSMFHVRLQQMVQNNPTFLTAIIPNIVKELTGYKSQ